MFADKIMPIVILDALQVRDLLTYRNGNGTGT